MPPIRGLIDKGSGTGRAAVTSPPTLFTSFAVPHEGRGLRVPAGDRLLEPHDDLGGGLRMVSVQGAAHDDALAGLGAIEPRAAHGRIQRYDALLTQPLPLCWPFSSSTRQIKDKSRTDELNGQHSVGQRIHYRMRQ